MQNNCRSKKIFFFIPGNALSQSEISALNNKLMFLLTFEDLLEKVKFSIGDEIVRFKHFWKILSIRCRIQVFFIIYFDSIQLNITITLLGLIKMICSLFKFAEDWMQLPLKHHRCPLPSGRRARSKYFYLRTSTTL